MWQAYRVRGQVSPQGTLTLENLPFGAGEEVEVIVLGENQQVPAGRGYPLRSTPITYDHPTAPVAASDWPASSGEASPLPTK
jgi:hypothetical protein